MGVQGLADGFLAGFRTMDNYQRGQKEDARAERAMSLREAESQRAADYQQWSMQRTTDRDEKADEQWQATFDQNKKNNEDTSKRGWAQLSLQQRQQTLAEQAAKRKQQQEDDALFLSQHAHIIQGSWDPATAQQLYANPETRAILEDSRAARLTPTFYASPEMKAANRTIMGHLSKVTQLGASGELDGKSEQELYGIYNTPEVIAAANTALSFELGKGVGDIDPDTGRVIKGKSLKGFVPGPSGESVVPVMTIQYDDGSTADKPATLGRSTDPDDPVKEIPVSQLIQYFGSQGNLIQQASQSGFMGTMSQKLGYTEGPDSQGLRDASANLHKQMTKDLAAVDRAAAKGEMDAGQVEDAKARITATYSQQGEGLRDVYGYHNPSPEPGKQGDKVKTWLQQDPQLLQLSQMAAQSQDPAIAQQYRIALAKDDETAMYTVLQQVAAQAEALQEQGMTDLRDAVLAREGGKGQPAQPAPAASPGPSSLAGASTYNSRFPGNVSGDAIAAGYQRMYGQ